MTLLLENSLPRNEVSKLILYVDENRTFYNNTLAQEFSSELPSFNSHNSSDWGPKRDPLYIVVPITIVYVIIFLTGLIGNASTCIVISRNKSMHTATNYYLFSLAISDLLLLISGLPPEIYFIWSKYPYVFGEAFCVLQGFAAETSANATVLTITAFTVERYVAICHPFLSHTMSKLSRAIKFIIAIWIVAMCLAIPQAMSFGIYYEELPDGRMVNDEHYVCIVKRIVIPHAFEISTFLFFVAPMTLITILYILIGLQLHRSTVGPSRGNSVKLKHRVYKPVVTYTNASTQAVLILNGDEAEKLQVTSQQEDGRKNFARNAQATRHVVKMLVAVVVAFFICWAPFHAQRLLAIYGEHTSSHMITAFRTLTYVSGVLYYLSTTVNPLLYHIMSHKFRQAFKETFTRFFRRGRHPPGGRCYSTLSGRSSQVNSHSNTDSCSRQSSLRYLETEMARLHDSRRPLVVSFRRKKQQFPKRTKQVNIFDTEEALYHLKEEPRRRDLRDHHIFYGDIEDKKLPVLQSITTGNLENDCSYIELHSNLQPTHICPLSEVNLSILSQHCVKTDQNFKANDKVENAYEERDEIVLKTRANSFRSRVTCESIGSNKILTKSRTMPHMGNEGKAKTSEFISNNTNCPVCYFKENYITCNEIDDENISNKCSHIKTYNTNQYVTYSSPENDVICVT